MCNPAFFPWRVQAPLVKRRRFNLQPPPYGWSVCVSAGGYLWCGFTVGGSTLGGGAGGGLGIKRGGNVGGTLGGVWGSEFPFSVVNSVSARVRLGGGVRLCVGVSVAAKILDNFWMASMIWVPKRVKGASGPGLARALERVLAASVAASEEYIIGIVPFWGKLYCFCCVLCPCLRHIAAVASVMKWGRVNLPPLLSIEVPCSTLLQRLMDEYFCT